MDSSAELSSTAGLGSSFFNSEGLSAKRLSNKESWVLNILLRFFLALLSTLEGVSVVFFSTSVASFLSSETLGSGCFSFTGEGSELKSTASSSSDSTSITSLLSMLVS